MGRAEHNLKRSGEDHGAGPRVSLKVVPGTAPDSGVRAICPFCGASNPTPEYFCCADWFAMMFPAAETENSRRTGRLSWLVLPNLETIRATIRDRLRRGSHLLVTLLASAIVAVLASLATQSRIASERPAAIPLASVQSPQPMVAPIDANAESEVASEAPRNPLPAMAEVVTPESPPAATVSVTSEPAAGPPQEPNAPRAAPEAQPVAAEAPANAAQETPPAPAVEIASVKTDAVVAAPPVAASSGRESVVKPARPAARSRRPSLPEPAEPAPRMPARAEVLEPEEAQPQIVTSLASPPEKEVVRRTEREASSVWWEPGRTARLGQDRDSSHWHSLRRGMNRDAVRRLLGEPKWKRHLVGTEIWLYEENSLYSDGWVSFADPGEELTGWRGVSSTH